jgi:hypothetical protein
MDKQFWIRHEQRMQGEILYGETLSELNDYIHQMVLSEKRVPDIDEVLAEVDYAGRPLHMFLEGVRAIAPETVYQYIFRLRKMLQVAETEYEGGMSA